MVSSLKDIPDVNATQSIFLHFLKSLVSYDDVVKPKLVYSPHEVRLGNEIL